MSNTPAALMRKAYDEEISQWEKNAYALNGVVMTEIIRAGRIVLAISEDEDSGAADHFERLRSEVGHRAALRALAAMTPTEKMRDAAYLGEDAEYSAVFGVDEAKAYILAAAEEGEEKP